MGSWRQVSAIFVALISTRCNSTFYYPDKTDYGVLKASRVSYEDLWIPSEDGEKLHGVFIPTTVANPLGTIVEFHGNAENLSSHVFSVLWARPAGYHIVAFDYRGYGRSSGKPDRAGTIRDGMAMLGWVASDKRVASTDVFIVGQSLGGAIALQSLLEVKPFPANVRAIVVDSSFGSYRQIAQRKLGGFFLTWPLQWPLSFLVTDDRSPLRTTDTLMIPKLMLHSQSDPVVPYSCGRALFEWMREPREMHDVPGKGHTSAFHLPNPTFRDLALAFFCRSGRDAETGLAKFAARDRCDRPRE